MTKKPTKKQLGYMNGLLDKIFGKYRKVYLKIEYGIMESSKELNQEQVSEIIDKFKEKNLDREEHIFQGWKKIKKKLNNQS